MTGGLNLLFLMIRLGNGYCRILLCPYGVQLTTRKKLSNLMKNDPLISTARIKQHISLRRDDQDDYLQALADAAIAHFENITGREVIGRDADPDNEYQVPFYTPIEQGALLLIGHWYENRESVSDKKLSEAPQATYVLWGPYTLYDISDPSC